MPGLFLFLVRVGLVPTQEGDHEGRPYRMKPFYRNVGRQLPALDNHQRHVVRLGRVAAKLRHGR